jgi:hypothetical protein
MAGDGKATVGDSLVVKILMSTNGEQELRANESSCDEKIDKMDSARRQIGNPTLILSQVVLHNCTCSVMLALQSRGSSGAGLVVGQLSSHYAWSSFPIHALVTYSLPLRQTDEWKLA